MTLETHLKRLIRNYHRRLQKLKEREALYGLDVTPGISLEIEDIEEKIADLERTLAETGERAEAAEPARSAPPAPYYGNRPHCSTLAPPAVNHKSALTRNPALRQLRRWLLQK